MLVNFFTKPLQGSIFWRLRKVIMGWADVEILKDFVPPPQKYCVKNHVSSDKTENLQKATYIHIVTGYQIRKIDGS